jgi:hypothetical protein
MTCQQQCIHPLSCTTYKLSALRLLESRRQRDVSVQQAKIIYTAARMGAKHRRKRHRVARNVRMHKPQECSGAEDTTYLSIRCNPEAVSITGEISPGFRANEASSNSFCMSPCPKNPLLLASAAASGRTSAMCNPKTGNRALETRKSTGARHVDGRTYRSPRLRAELQSDSVVARSPRLVEPLLILLS